MTDEAVKPPHMTDIEWEALQSEDGGPDPDETPVLDLGDDDTATGADGDDTAKGGEGEDTAAGAGGEDTAKGGEGQDTVAGAGDDDDAAPPAPLLVAQAPADAETKLADITKQKDALATKFDDGEMTAKEYQTQLGALDKQEREIELAVHKAQIAADLNAQQARNAFLREVQDFTSGTLYKESPLAWSALDAAVKKVGSDPANANLTGRQILEKAHAEVLKDKVLATAFGQHKAAAGKEDGGKQQKKAVVLPPNLGRLPAAEPEDTSGDRFAALDRLQRTNPIEYEKAVGKLAPADLDAYLSR